MDSGPGKARMRDARSLSAPGPPHYVNRWYNWNTVAANPSAIIKPENMQNATNNLNLCS